MRQQQSLTRSSGPWYVSFPMVFSSSRSPRPRRRRGLFLGEPTGYCTGGRRAPQACRARGAGRPGGSRQKRVRRPVARTERLTMLRVLCLLLAWGGQGDALPAGWVKFAARGEGFSISSPATFKRQQLTDKGPDQKDVKITVFRANVGDESYLVTISEFSAEYMKNPPKVIFDNARDGSVARSGGKLVRESDIKLGSHPGREVVVAAGEKAGFVRARIFVANGRQYAVMLASKTEAGIDSADARRFFESFRLLSIPKKKP